MSIINALYQYFANHDTIYGVLFFFSVATFFYIIGYLYFFAVFMCIYGLIILFAILYMTNKCKFRYFEEKLSHNNILKIIFHYQK
jgi:hypothetical protein